LMRYETRTPLSPMETLSLARDHFVNDVGLAETPGPPRGVRFEGGGGGVTVTAERRSPAELTVVEIVAREWDSEAVTFLKRLANRGRPPSWWERLFFARRPPR
ncbi:MAG: hypothetical protein NZ518_11125, partial [Dehalococcoidia bacterium]|nr:hypothetical protein [Dehalococcoidia bacterium]